MGKLTKTVIDALPLPKTGQVFIWDGDLRGFGVRASAGGAKTFVLQYRNDERRQRRLTIGRCNVFTVEQARTIAKIKLGEVAMGSDPQQDRQDRHNAPTVAQVCDWYLAEAESGRLLGRRNLPIKASTLYMDKSRIERHIKPLIGTRQVRALEVSDIAEFQANIAEGKTARGTRRSGRGRVAQGGAGAAARTIASLHAIFAHARRMGIIKENPAVGIRRLGSQRRTRRLSAIEIGAFGRAMRELSEHGEAQRGLDVVRLLALTGFRLNEAQAIERVWLEHEAPFISFPDTKSGQQRRPIARKAMDVLEAQPQTNRVPYVFPADLSDFHYRQGPDVITRICHLARLEKVTAHTLRHTFGSVAGDLGFSELTIAAMLGHGKRGVTQGYIHIDEGLRIAIECTANKIADLLDGRSNSVTPFASMREAYASLDRPLRSVA